MVEIKYNKAVKKLDETAISIVVLGLIHRDVCNKLSLKFDIALCLYSEGIILKESIQMVLLGLEVRSEGFFQEPF